MAEATLAIRDGEGRQYFVGPTPPPIIKGDERIYGVALVESPPLPGNRHPRSNPLLVCCIANYPTQDHLETAWGWIHLTPDTKELIGNDLVELACKVGTWIWLMLTPAPAAP